MNHSNALTSLRNRVWIFPALALTTLVIGQICAKACAFIHGDILGLDLNILGMLFYSILLVLSVLRLKMFPQGRPMKTLAAIASVGMGAEIILIRFQVQNGVYCPKCLISGFFLIAMFLLIAPNLRKWLIILLVFLGAVFASFTFSGSVIPSYAAELGVPHFGNDRSQIEIIVYSDYLCPACRKADEEINADLRKLKDKARIRFVDVPMHSGSLDYAEVFLYAWFESGNNLEAAIKVREVLFDAGKTKTDQPGLLRVLKAKGIPFKADRERAREIFRSLYNPLMSQDKVNATPTMVVVNGNERKSYVGGKKISMALEEVLSSRNPGRQEKK